MSVQSFGTSKVLILGVLGKNVIGCSPAEVTLRLSLLSPSHHLHSTYIASQTSSFANQCLKYIESTLIQSVQGIILNLNIPITDEI
jgi:hypothetical protein